MKSSLKTQVSDLCKQQRESHPLCTDCAVEHPQKTGTWYTPHGILRVTIRMDTACGGEVVWEELFHRVYREVDSKTEGVLKIGSLDIFNELKRNFPLEMAGIRSSDVARALPGFAKRVHIKGGNIYYLMRR